MDLSRVEQFCDAVDKNREGILDSAAHLTCYNVKRPKSTVKPQVTTRNQFGSLDLDVKKRRTQLCVPSTARVVVEPTATPSGSPVPTPTATATPAAGPPLEHFELYRTKKTPRAEKFQRREVDLVDPFMGLDETVKLTRQVRLGVPTDKDEEGITNDVTHLSCYVVQAPRFVRQDVEVENQFGEFRLTVRRPSMLCVPTLKQVVSEDD